MTSQSSAAAARRSVSNLIVPRISLFSRPEMVDWPTAMRVANSVLDIPRASLIALIHP